MTAYLFANARTALIGACIAALLLAWVMWGVVPDAWLTAWVGAILAINAARYLADRRRQKYRQAESSAIAWYTAGTFGAGVVWGTAGVLFFSPDSIHHQIFLAFVLGGMVAGAVASYAAWLPAFYAFAVPALAPIAARYVWEGDEISTVMGGLLTVYGVALAVLAHNVNRVLRRSVDLQAALGKSEKRFQDIVESATDWIWETDADYRYTYLSPQVARYLNQPAQYFVGRSRFDNPGLANDAERFERHKSDIEARRPFRDFEYDFEISPGEMITISISGKPVFEESGDFAGYRGTTTNITERRQSERELHDSEQRYRDLVEGSLQGIIIHQDGRLVLANQAAADIFGYVPGEGRGQEISGFVAPEDAERVGKYARARAQGLPAPDEFEFRGIKKDGTRIDLIATARTIQWEGRHAVQNTVVDITSRKRAEESLRRLGEAIEELSELFVLWDAEDRLVVCNERFREINAPVIDTTQPGTLFEDHIRTALAKGLYPEAAGREDDWLRERLDRHRNPGDPFELQRQDGKWISIREQRLPDGGVVTMSTDITARKRAELAVGNSEARFRDFADTAADWFWEMGPDLRFTYMSNRVESIVGVPAAFHIGKTREELAGEAVNDERWQEHLQDLRQHKPFRNFNFLRKGHDGRLQYMSTSGNPVFDDKGAFMGYRGSATDITERIEVERIKNEFVSTVSHELRTPLTSIKGSLGLIKADTFGALPAKAADMIDIAYNNSDRLIHIINDILDIEKMESGKMVFRMEPVAITPLVEEAMTANAGYGEQLGVEFTLGAALDGVQVLGDSDRLLQVMANLLSNAAKFSPAGGRVTVALSRRHDMVRVAVTDRGAGIPREFHDQVFEKFVQADSSNTRQLGGTGLGLSICKAIVEQHNGEIGFTTEDGKGATFHFDLPIWGSGATT